MASYCNKESSAFPKMNLGKPRRREGKEYPSRMEKKWTKEEDKESSTFTKMVKKRNPEKKYPNRMGKKWTKEEDKSLLAILVLGTSIDIIANKHNRTLGSIRSRINLIVYNMYNDDISENDIIKSTGLTEEQYKQAIEWGRKKDILKKEKKKRRQQKQQKVTTTKTANILEGLSSSENILNDDIKEIKEEIKQINKNIQKIWNFLKDESRKPDLTVVIPSP